MINDDNSAWYKFPQHRLWFNKLWLSEQLGYLCGPGGIPVPEENHYIIRPIYNLRGMGVGANIQKISPLNLHAVPPGYFWCELFEGNHYSVDLKWNNKWELLSAFQGINSKNKLYKFERWIKTNINITIPKILDQLKDCEYINVEFIENKIIEVHLRISPDPDCNEMIPIWEEDQKQLYKDYTWVPSEDDADGYLEQKRLGFFVK